MRMEEFPKKSFGISTYVKWNFKPQISSIFHFDWVSDGRMAHVLGVKSHMCYLRYILAYKFKTSWLKGEKKLFFARVHQDAVVYYSKLGYGVSNFQPQNYFFERMKTFVVKVFQEINCFSNFSCRFLNPKKIFQFEL